MVGLHYLGEMRMRHIFNSPASEVLTPGAEFGDKLLSIGVL